MSLINLSQQPAPLAERLHDALAVTPSLIADVVRDACRRFPSRGQAGKERVEQLIRLGAWTDAALALIELELPQWQIRRLAYDEGEWHCALSRQRELPDWLDQSIDGRHHDLALAMLSALVEAQRREHEPQQRPARATGSERTLRAASERQFFVSPPVRGLSPPICAGRAGVVR